MQTATATAMPAASLLTLPRIQLVGSADRDPVERVLVKFNFSNRNRIPKWIPEIDRSSDREVDAIHQMEARKQGQGTLAQVGRIRRGRVDTGVEAIKSTGSVHQVALLRRGLVNNGFGFAHAHWFERKNKANRKIFVVVMAFEPGRESPNLSRDTVEDLRTLANLGWKECYGWDNPDGTVTINCVSLVPDMPFQRVLRIRDGAIVMEDIAGATSEEQE